MVMIEDYSYPNGLQLLSSWQSGDVKSRETMQGIFDAALLGEFDENFLGKDYGYPDGTMFVVSYYTLSNYDPDYKTDEVEVWYDNKKKKFSYPKYNIL